ncbi:MAG: hypothetical protein LLG06_15365 [Desulfobacteraceae bacterium]|nr:hypothetical protein [Desulfobacteraceae bacterium]
MVRPRKVFLATSMLIHNRRRMALSLGATAFTVLIMFMEMGFFNGINDSQSLLAGAFNADLIMMSDRSVHMNKFNRFNRVRLQQGLAFPEVSEVIPVYKGIVTLENKETKQSRLIFLLAFPPDAAPLDIGLSPSVLNELKKPGTILFDSRSRAIYGGMERDQIVTVDGRDCRVAGFFDFGPNFSNDGTILMGQGTFLQYRPPSSRDQVSYGLIRTKPGVDVQSLKKDILRNLPPDIILLTPEEMRQREVRYTITAVPIGAIFGVGLVIGFFIGVMICYQILYNEIADHMPQYATLKAMGFSEKYLFRLVIRQSLLVSLLGFVFGMGFSFILYVAIEASTGILMFMTLGRIAIILTLTVTMCTIAGILAVKKVTSSDPAEVFG